ncbi:MAG: acyl-CoA dehydrogenase family protein, partial [Streptosporangiaceae bacterium]
MSQATQTQPPARLPGPAAGVAAGATAPDLLYSEEETALREAVRALLTDQAGWREVLARTESGHAYDTELWRKLAGQVGCAGLLVPETAGGAGASYREAAVVAEELGRFAAAVPFLGSAVVATTALLAAGGDELLADAAAGAVTVALAVPFATVPGSRPAPTVRIDGPAAGDAAGTYRLTGTVTGIADALTADVLLVPADGVPYGLYAVRVDEAGVTVAPVSSLDMTRQLCDVTLE